MLNVIFYTYILLLISFWFKLIFLIINIVI